MQRIRLIVFFLLCLTWVYPAIAIGSPDKTLIAPVDPDDEIFDESSSLDDEDIDESWDGEKGSVEEKKDSLWDIFDQTRFTLQQNLAYQTGESDGLIVNRSSIRVEWSNLFSDNYYLHFDGKLTMFGSHDHSNDSLEEDMREGYLQISMGNLSVSFGKKIVVWGEADGAVVTDIISPRDKSEFAFTTLSESRVGQYLLLFDLYTDSGTWSFIVNPDPRINTGPESCSEYYIDSFPDSLFEVEVKNPDESDTEFAFRWKQTFGKSDLSIMAGDLVENQAVYRYSGSNSGKYQLSKGFSRYQMIGIAANYASGNFLWKQEVAYKANRSFQKQTFTEYNNLLEKDVLDMALGVEYNYSKFNLYLEASNQLILNWESTLYNEENETSIIFIMGYDFLNETLKLEYSLSYQIQNRYTVHKVESDYEFTDNLRGILSFTYLDFDKESSALWQLRKKDRVDLNIKYIF
ncbi:MAG: hypothetical protein GY714_22270 [Desulfobacterales bacterium]|nr:hypothetical protein [Desulfobacterales bacterium]